ncbi:MAG: twin-arginine translocase subunit TatC [Chloroflexi bacterium]|nr:twin-arginine translocase subunit TatC [Chloroflexota bacterium]
MLRSVSVLAAAVIAAFWVAEPVMEFLAEPAGGLANLQAIQVTEEIGVFMRVAMSVGIAVAFPYIALELWLFAAPGLKPREKKLGLVGIPLATLLFVTGMAFTYFVLLPAALPFLGGFTEIAQLWTAHEYFAFVTGLMLWIGIFFEFPLVIYVLTAIGLIQPRVLAQQWRLAIVIIALLAAAVTPTVGPGQYGAGDASHDFVILYQHRSELSRLRRAGQTRTEAQKNAYDGGAG